jgi:hypothetical protein
MRKRLLIVIGLIGLIGILALLTLKQYSAEIVHAVVVNAVIQKAPEDFPQTRIEEVFDRRFAKARKDGEVSAYYEELLVVSHRLEKLQRLERKEVIDLLSEIDR